MIELNLDKAQTSKLGHLPKEWSIRTLSYIADRIIEKNKGTISENVLTISAQHGLVSQTDFFNKKVSSKNLEGYYLLTKGDFAYNKSYSNGYPMGAIKSLSLYDKGVVSSLYICFRLRNKVCIRDYYQHYFNSNLWHNEVAEIAQEGARNHGLLNVSVKEFFNINIVVPPLKEQQKIAEILSTVDDQIENTEQLIEKTKVLKKGLMQRLLTKGIGHTKFKQTDLGEIPEGWSIYKLNEVSDYVDYRGKTPIKTESGVPLITAKNIKYGYINYDVSKEYIAKEDYELVMRRGVPHKGDVLITTEAPLGNVAQVDDEHIALAQRVIKYRGRTSLLDNNYLKFYMLSAYFQSQLLKNATGSTVKGIKGKQLHSLSVIVPSSLNEQEKIASILMTVDEQIEIFQQEKAKYTELKKGLIQQLLTGKVRVKV